MLTPFVPFRAEHRISRVPPHRDSVGGSPGRLKTPRSYTVNMIVVVIVQLIAITIIIIIVVIIIVVLIVIHIQ